MVVQTNDIARISLFNMRAIAGHKGQRIRDHHIFAKTHLTKLHALFIFTRHHTQEGHAVTMFRVHVGLNFKDEAGEFLLRRFHFTDVRRARHRCGRPLHQAIQHMVHTKVTQRGTKEDRGDFTGQEQLFIELVRGTLNQFKLVAQLLSQIFTDSSVEIRAI